MTNQEAFDTVVRHLLTQRTKSEDPWVSGRTQCVYRGWNGATKCAIGCLISDDQYRADMEGRSVKFLVEVDGLVLCPDLKLLQSLQFVHDCHDVEEWAAELRCLASRHGLSPLVLEEFPACSS